MIANEVIGPELQAKLGASDLVQDTFLEAQRHLGVFRGQTKAETTAWLRKILECRLANIRRSYLATEKRAANREVTIDTLLASSSRIARSWRAGALAEQPRHPQRVDRGPRTGAATIARALPPGRGLAAPGTALVGRDRPADRLHGRRGAQGLEPGIQQLRRELAEHESMP